MPSILEDDDDLVDDSGELPLQISQATPARRSPPTRRAQGAHRARSAPRARARHAVPTGYPVTSEHSATHGHPTPAGPPVAIHPLGIECFPRQLSLGIRGGTMSLCQTLECTGSWALHGNIVFSLIEFPGDLNPLVASGYCFGAR